MTEEKDRPMETAAPQAKEPEPQPEETTAIEAEAAAKPAVAELTEQPVTYDNGPTEKRGRLVAAGLIAAGVLTLISMVVAGIFHITASRLITCPVDLPVNDPAPIHWSQMTGEKSNPASLGVPDKLSGITSLKKAPAESE
jgi:hypothetical protein